MSGNETRPHEERLVISSTHVFDKTELQEIFGPEAAVRSFDFVPKKLTGEEVAVAFAIGLAANIAVAQMTNLTNRVITWLRNAIGRGAADAKDLQITISVAGNSVTVRDEADIRKAEALIKRWIEQNDPK